MKAMQIIETKVENWQKRCKHKIVIINPLYGIYCKRCHRNLADLEYHDFVTNKIKKGKWEKSYALPQPDIIWDDD